MIENRGAPGTKWPCVVEIQSDFKNISIMQQDVEEYFKALNVEHAIAIEQSAKIIVRFSDDADARLFNTIFNGRLIQL
jgi:hypothetical protein